MKKSGEMRAKDEKETQPWERVERTWFAFCEWFFFDAKK